MADEKLNTGQEQTEQPSLFDTGPEVPAPEPPAPEVKRPSRPPWKRTGPPAVW